MPADGVNHLDRICPGDVLTDYGGREVAANQRLCEADRVPDLFDIKARQSLAQDYAKELTVVSPVLDHKDTVIPTHPGHRPVSSFLVPDLASQSHKPGGRMAMFRCSPDQSRPTRLFSRIRNTNSQPR